VKPNLANKIRILKIFIQLLPFSRNPFQTARWLYQMRRKFTGVPKPAEFTLGNHSFECRTKDWATVEEVLLTNEYQFVEKNMANLSTVVDLGANIGLFSIYCLSHFTGVRVWSVEASRTTFEVLTTNQKKNFSEKWQLFHYAVWDREGEISFEDEKISTGSHVSVNGSASVKVPSITLEKFFAGTINMDIDLLKMDIEGAEQVVLTQSEEILRRVEHLILEIHPNRVETEVIMDIVHRNFAYVHTIPGRQSSKPLILASKSISQLSL